MMSEEEYQELMDRIALSRKERDEAVEAAQERFSDALAAAYEAGLSFYDINHATGLSITTVRSRLKQRGIRARRP